MRENALKRKWAAGQATLNGWLSIGNPFSAEVMAAQGWDSLCVDLQHGFFDYSDARGMLQAIAASGVVPLARVPWREPGVIMKMLDAGAYGIICPMVNTPDEAAELVSFCRYPPHGTRSFGPIRANFSAGPDYHSSANDEVLVFAMIETLEAYENVEAICQTPGLDGVYIGPADLTLGVTNGRLKPGQDREEPEMVEAIRNIAKAAKSAGIQAALHTGSPAYAAKAIGWGFDMVTVGGDAIFLAAGAKAAVGGFHAALGQSAPEGQDSGY